MLNSHLSGSTQQLICSLECRIKCTHPPLTQTALIQQELAAMRNQMSGQINVEVDAKQQPDLSAIMAEIREQYETVAAKNQRDLQAWFQTKVRLDQNPGGDIYLCNFSLPT